jgi:hypothetical protein
MKWVESQTFRGFGWGRRHYEPTHQLDFNDIAWWQRVSSVALKVTILPSRGRLMKIAHSGSPVSSLVASRAAVLIVNCEAETQKSAAIRLQSGCERRERGGYDRLSLSSVS